MCEGEDQIGQEAAPDLATMLMRTKSLTKFYIGTKACLNKGNNKLGPTGAARLMPGLAANKTIVLVDLGTLYLAHTP